MIDAPRENFSRTLVISAYSFTELAQRAKGRMGAGGSLLTLTYGGSTRVMPNYNVMGVCKAALDAAMETPLAEGLRLEKHVFASLFDTADQKEGMAAFREKRAPAFTRKASQAPRIYPD